MLLYVEYYFLLIRWIAVFYQLNASEVCLILKIYSTNSATININFDTQVASTVNFLSLSLLACDSHTTWNPENTDN